MTCSIRYRELTRRRTRINQLFTYAKAMEARENGVAILLNMPEDSPVAICWISEDGTDIKVIRYPDVDKEKGFGLDSFSVSPPDKRAYFLNTQNAIIFEAEWPL